MSRNVEFTSRGLFPATGGFYSNAWQRGNLKLAALRGFYFSSKVQLEDFYNNPDQAMQKAKWFIDLPTYEVSFNGATAKVNEFIGKHGWLKFQQLLAASENVGTGNSLNGVKVWMQNNLAEQLKYTRADYFLTAMETLGSTAAGTVGGYWIGTGIDAGSAQVKVDAADIKNRYLRGNFPNATGTN